MGKAPVFEMCSRLLETRWYAFHGIPVFACGPGLLTVSHEPHKFVQVANIAGVALIYIFTAKKLELTMTSSIHYPYK